MKRFKLLSTALLAALITTAIPNPALADSVVTYEEKDTGNNMGESFVGSATVTYGQTPSYTVKIPKSITLDSDGSAKYTVGVKGKIPSKYEVSVVPDETILMEEENKLLDDITANVSAEKTTWTPAELDPDTYNETTNNTIQMQSIDLGKFKGTLNFNVSAEIPKVELKDASDEVKAANKFLGSFNQDDAHYRSSIYTLKDVTDAEIGDIVYLSSITVNGYSGSYTFKEGYYRVLKFYSVWPNNVVLYDNMSNGVTGGYLEYLGESYPV